MDRELLLEIGVEELPAAWLPGLTKQLSEKLQARLKEMRLTPDVAVESFSTPRRLTARIGRMPERQEDLDETVTGPPVSAAVNAAGEPTPAGLGFAVHRDHSIRFGIGDLQQALHTLAQCRVVDRPQLIVGGKERHFSGRRSGHERHARRLRRR